VLQFAISITMLICTSVVYDQLQFLRQKDLGFSGEQVVNVTMPDSVIQRQASTLYHRLKGYSNILEVSTSSTTPGKDLFYSIMKIETPTGVASRGVNYCMASYDYVQTLGIPVVKGRNFSRRFATDTSAVLINEAMVKSIKWNDPIGKRFTFDDGMPNTVDRSYTVVGVIKDFHQQSLHSPIQPLAVFFQEQNYYLNVKVRATDVEGTVAFMQHAWQEVNRGKPFSYTFLDQDFYSQYLADVKRGQIFSLFSVVCVVISCLGLFGLAAYTTEQRAKEIGIRKAIGASVPSIVALFYKNFLALIGIGLLIAFPFSYFFMRNWLLTFAYQTDIRWVSFLSATLITLIITMGSISFHTIRSAMTNPVKTLRSE
jgi:putative ABC transport system permease protein